jgi:hypothetical protein
MSKITPIVTVELDKKRHLRFDLNALVNIEKAAGKNYTEAIISAGNGSMTDTRVVLWGALLSDDPTLTLDQVGEMIDLGNLADMSAAVVRAFGVSIPDPTTGEPKNEVSPSIGENSGPTGA